MEFQFSLMLVMFLFAATNRVSNGMFYSGECHKDDLEGLQLFKSGITYDSAGLMDKWQGLHCCQWFGIQCDDNSKRVTQINLFLRSDIEDPTMNGSISDHSLALLPNLQVLNLFGLSGISGEIPPLIGQSLPNLKQLVLFGNMFTGTVPESISTLSNLIVLDLAANQLSGSIPLSLVALKNLTLLRLYKNRFSGLIPESFSSLTSLTELALDHNSLSGKIPERIGDLTSLWFLGLNHNQLSGNIPESMRNFASVQTLYLNENNLSGRIPEWFLKMSKLRYLNVSYNQLVGEIPQGQPLIDLPPSAFEGNKDLCGKPLKPCN